MIRAFLSPLFVGLLLLASHTVSLHAMEYSDDEILRILSTEQPRDKAIDDGLAWIRTQQQDNGALADKLDTVMTSFGLMAHLSAGVGYDDPEHGEWMRKSLRYVLSRQSPSGFYGELDKSRMYGHGITTLMLGESLGMIRDPILEEQVRQSLVRAVAVTVNAALVKKSDQHAGGWRYKPDDTQSDLSLSGWQVMSLHAAQQVGIPVPEDVIRNALAYARRMTNQETGEVGYQDNRREYPALRGLALMCYAIAGEEESPVVTQIANRIVDNPIEWSGNRFFYRAYYDAVGMARTRQDLWEDYGQRLESLLVENQREDGAWATPPGGGEGKHGTIYITSMAVLTLTVNRHLLPVYQR